MRVFVGIGLDSSVRRLWQTRVLAAFVREVVIATGGIRLG